LSVDSISTIEKMIVGLIAGVIIGVVISFCIIVFGGEQAVLSLLVALESIPKVALTPLFALWFGFGSLPSIVMASLLSFFPITINITQGIRRIDPSIKHWCKLLNARRTKIFFLIYLPYSIPAFFDGLKIAAPLALVGVVIGEMYGSTQGLGHRLVASLAALQTEISFACIFCLMAISGCTYNIIRCIEMILLKWPQDEKIK
jgi:NitT/TauT family transport system permease protein